MNYDINKQNKDLLDLGNQLFIHHAAVFMYFLIMLSHFISHYDFQITYMIFM